MRKKRIVIVYERFIREGINVALLQEELQKRGYSVTVKSKYDDFSLRRKDALIIPNGYCSADYLNYIYRFNCKNEKVINLQVEQLFSKTEEEQLSCTADGLAKNADFICWGQNRYNQLVECGVDSERISICGAIHTDSVRERFNLLWRDKSEIAERFNIPEQKKWLLFISSFGFTTDDSPFFALDYKLEKDMALKRATLERDSQAKILQYFETYLNSDSEPIIIYRPHPSERVSTALSELKNKFPNRFFIISECNIKQWILCCDTVSMWNSTSIIECFYAKKNCLILRPEALPDDQDYYLFEGCRSVSSPEQFLESVNNADATWFPISDAKLKEYYDISNEYSYIRTCDEIERIVGREDSTRQLENHYVNMIQYYFRNHIIIKCAMKAVYRFLCRTFEFRLSESKFNNRLFIEDWNKAINDKAEFKELQEKIKEAI